jgi:hypothetical protein
MLVSVCSSLWLVLMKPAVHVGLGSACGYIPPLPPPFGPGNVLASRGLCLTFAHLFLSRTFAYKDTFTVLLHGKHVKGRTALRARTGLLGTVRPVLGTVPNSRSIPVKVAKHTTLSTFDHLSRQRVEPTTDRYCVPWVVGCQEVLQCLSRGDILSLWPI